MTRSTLILALAASACITSALAQTSSPPRNDLPQPYRTARDWGELPAGMKWAAVTSIEAAADGSIFVIHRCTANSCAGRPEPPILKFDAGGKLRKAFGGGMFVFPHGSGLDREGNLWVTDGGGRDGIGHQVIKFSPDGVELMRLGKAGVSGSGPDLFDQPNDVAVAPNGDIFVTDSHRRGKNNRVVKFDKTGKFIKEWGHKGSGAGELSEPHAIACEEPSSWNRPLRFLMSLPMRSRPRQPLYRSLWLNLYRRRMIGARDSILLGHIALVAHRQPKLQSTI
jgi:hypothetical protein